MRLEYLDYPPVTLNQIALYIQRGTISGVSLFKIKDGWMVKFLKGSTFLLLHVRYVPMSYSTIDEAVIMLHDLGMFRITVETEGLDL